MADDLKDHRPRGGTRVDLGEDWDLLLWSERFGVDKTDLQNAIEIVGPMVSDIEAYFNRTLDTGAIRGHAPRSQ